MMPSGDDLPFEDDTVFELAEVRNIGGPADRIGEAYGVAVDETVRHRGVGSDLLRRVVAELDGDAAFVLCEARTSTPGDWKVAQKAGFRPVGYAPYAHAMPIGSESMVRTAYAQPWPLRPHRADAPRLRGSTARLAAAVLVPAAPPMPATGEQPSHGAAVVVRRDDAAGAGWFSDTPAIYDSRAGVVGLTPMQGVDGRSARFEFPYYVAAAGGAEVGCARVAFDRTDARARVLGLRTDGGVGGALWAGLLAGLEELAGGGPLSVLVWVRADAAAWQEELCRHGFVPTAYLPGLVATTCGRGDVVQYTRLTGRSLAASVAGVTANDWSEARAVIEQVVRA